MQSNNRASLNSKLVCQMFIDTACTRWYNIATLVRFRPRRPSKLDSENAACRYITMQKVRATRNFVLILP